MFKLAKSIIPVPSCASAVLILVISYLVCPVIGVGTFNWEYIDNTHDTIDTFKIFTNADKSMFIPMSHTQPTHTSEAMQGAYYLDTLAEVSTPLLRNMPNRRSNIILTCKMINETVIMPGVSFSFNQTVGIRTETRGFKPAPSFMGGQVLDSVGGGICQVSSTLYYACLLSNLEIVSRSSHSMSADYTEKLGLDAAVSWGSIDYIFKNSTNSPIKIFAWVEDTRVYAKIVGTKMNDNTVEIESVTLSVTPYQTIYKDNLSLAPGQTKIVQEAHTGSVVETYRVVKDAGGNVINRKLEAKSIYYKSDEIIERNPQSIPENPPSASSSPPLASSDPTPLSSNPPPM